MRLLRWHYFFGTLLIAISTAIYFIYFLVFKDPLRLIGSFLGNLGFLPVEVLLVTLIIHRLLDEKEKRSILDKMDMVIGVFFSEVGIELLRKMVRFDRSSGQIHYNLLIKMGTAEELSATDNFFRQYQCSIDTRASSLGELRFFLSEKRDLLLRLMENPNLLEHETFTELLRAVIHVDEELKYRTDIENLSQADYRHLSEDLRRAYILLISQWIRYMKSLKRNYPYLFSLAFRVNPFNPDASAEI